MRLELITTPFANSDTFYFSFHPLILPYEVSPAVVQENSVIILLQYLLRVSKVVIPFIHILTMTMFTTKTLSFIVHGYFVKYKYLRDYESDFFFHDSAKAFSQVGKLHFTSYRQQRFPGQILSLTPPVVVMTSQQCTLTRHVLACGHSIHTNPQPCNSACFIDPFHNKASVSYFTCERCRQAPYEETLLRELSEIDDLWEALLRFEREHIRDLTPGLGTYIENSRFSIEEREAALQSLFPSTFWRRYLLQSRDSISRQRLQGRREARAVLLEQYAQLDLDYEETMDHYQIRQTIVQCAGHLFSPDEHRQVSLVQARDEAFRIAGLISASRARLESVIQRNMYEDELNHH